MHPNNPPLYSIQQLAKASGTTSRTLRHYDALGILKPSCIGANGYRYYDDQALVRLQRILLLRQLGLGLEAIGQVLEQQDAQAHKHTGEARILRDHLALLRTEQQRLANQINAVERTIAALDTDSPTDHTTPKATLMDHNIFDGFDHTQYRDEVERRWGADAYRSSDAWWRGLGAAGQTEWQAQLKQLNSEWIAAHDRGEDPVGPVVQQLAARHVAWLQSIPGTPASAPNCDLNGYVAGLAEMYVADERFAANYGGASGARFVRDALLAYLATS